MLRNVLIVDDNPEMRSIIANALETSGHTVFTAADGDAALRWLTDASQACGLKTVVVMDVRMPQMSGMQVLASLWLRRDSVRVILMTAFPDLQAHAIAERLGAVALLEKPFDVGHLRTLVDALP
jgi:DNA-binding NtrC family response regulator